MLAKNILLIPGPVAVAEPVLAAMARPMVDHRGLVFKAVLERISSRLKPIFGTKSDVVLLGSSGTGGLESAVSSMFSAGDKVLVCPIGVFGQRLAAIAKTWGLDVEVLDTPWGEALDAQRLAARLAQDTKSEIKGILLTHNETSTGSQNDMAALSSAIGKHPASVVVDSVSGLGASKFEMDAWGFDVVVSASQKAIAVPPGLAMVAFSARAWERMAKAKGPTFYFDLRKGREFAELGQTPWTPPVSVAFALDVALERFEAETAERVWHRHGTNADAIRAAVTALGLTLFSKSNAHSPTVVAINVPEGVVAADVQKTMREVHGVVISGGQKELKGKIFRIGTMGDVLQAEMIGALGAFELALAQHGANIQLGAGVQAALKVYQASRLVAA
jgi:aspartate aminotransferase-like enzyme